MYQIPKNTKQEIKLSFIYLRDLGIIAITFFIGSQIFEFFGVHGFMLMISYLFLFILGVWFCFKTSSHPVDRNISMITYYLIHNRNQYYEITRHSYLSLTQMQKGRVTNEQNDWSNEE